MGVAAAAFGYYLGTRSVTAAPDSKPASTEVVPVAVRQETAVVDEGADDSDDSDEEDPQGDISSVKAGLFEECKLVCATFLLAESPLRCIRTVIKLTPLSSVVGPPSHTLFSSTQM